MTQKDVQYPEGCMAVNPNSTNTELIRRLKNLSEALQKSLTNIESNSPGRYADLVLHLTDERFLNNKNKEIQLLLACCIADLFRIFAPNSPVDGSDRLKSILFFLTTVVGNSVDKENSMYRFYLYFIENIGVVETMQLALKLGDDAYVILRQLIKNSLGSINEKCADEHIQGILLGICSKLIQGVDQIANIVLDAIFYFIVQPQKINNREAYRMARDLIRTNQTTLEPYVALLLKRGLESGVLDECDLISHKKLYDLICELHKFAPEMISTALPSLINLLRSEDVDTRRETAQLFGNLFGDQNSRLAEDEPEVWDEYMKRFGDVNEKIRCICIRNAENILVFHPELRGQVTDAIILRCQDVDENVRLEVITMIQRLTERKFEALSERLLINVIDRIRDKKVKVRHAAIYGLSQLHRAVFSDDKLTNLERASVLNIFSSIMNHYYQPLMDDSLIPYKLEVQKRMEILISIFLYLNNYGVKAVEQILIKQSFQRRLLYELLKFFDDKSEPQKSKTMDDVVKRIVECHPDPAKFSLVFRQFMEHLRSDRQLLLLVKYISEKEYTCKKVESAVLEILHRLRGHKLSAEFISTMKSFLFCSAPLQFDKTAVSTLIDKAVVLIKGDTSDNRLDCCQRLIKLLKIVADAYPHCFITAPTLERLVDLIEMEDLPETENLLNLVITIAAEIKPDELLARDMIARYVSRCEILSLNGTPRVAKYAVRCISNLLNEEQARDKLTNILQNSLPHVSISDPQCCTALKALSSCIEADAFEFCSILLDLLKTKIVDLLLDQNIVSGINILCNYQSKQQDSAMNDGPNNSELSDDSAVFDGNYVAIKKHCLKFVAKFLVSVAQYTDCNVESIIKNVFKLYSAFLEAKGNIFNKSCRSIDTADFRLIAGSSMLKLAAKPRYAKYVTADDLVMLSALCYDDESEVRHRFFSKLNKLLMALHLHIEYMGLFSLVALNEEVEFRNRIRALVDANIVKRRKYLSKLESKEVAPYYQPEYCLAYAVYILSKLPLFESIDCEPILWRLTECIWFLLEIFNSRKEPGSLEFIHNIFKTVKGSTDSNMQDCTKEEMQRKNEKIWALCDIGILLISYRMKNLVKDVDCKPLLSKRFFLNMGRANTKIYVPVSFVEEMKSKKINSKHRQADVTESSTKLSNGPSKQSISRSDILEASHSSERKIEKKKRNKCKNNIQTNDEFQMQKCASSKTEKTVVKRSKPSSKKETSQLTPSATTSLAKDKKMRKRPAPLKSLDNESDLEAPKASSSKEDSRARGSLEDCDYSPIRPINGRPSDLVKSNTTSRKLPFMSSTPVVPKKRQRVTANTNENSAAASKVDNKPKETGKSRAVKSRKKGEVKSDKVRKVSATRKANEKASTQTAETSGIASRLRSRQTQQSDNAKSSKI